VRTPVRSVELPTASDLDQALRAVREHLAPTPLLPSPVAPDTYLKLECLTPAGSFKIRGALAALAALTDEERAAGVITASAGNHALGVLHAAAVLGVDATVVVPRTASSAKVSKLRRLGGHLIEAGEDYDEAEAHALSLARRAGHYLSPYNDPQVIAGQATIGPEIRAVLDGPLTVIAPVGGGGLLAGLSLWAVTEEGVDVVGVESAASLGLSAAVDAGEIVTVPVGPTLADGLAGNLEPGSITPSIIADHAAVLTSVDEAEIRTAIRYLAEEHGLVVEGSGAVGLAAVLAGKVTVTGPAVVVITGRNIAMPTFAEVLSSAATSALGWPS
jgi:threonine dehydratase